MATKTASDPRNPRRVCAAARNADRTDAGCFTLTATRSFFFHASEAGIREGRGLSKRLAEEMRGSSVGAVRPERGQRAG